jgi:hypothetical protein
MKRHGMMENFLGKLALAGTLFAGGAKEAGAQDIPQQTIEETGHETTGGTTTPNGHPGEVASNDNIVTTPISHITGSNPHPNMFAEAQARTLRQNQMEAEQEQNRLDGLRIPIEEIMTMRDTYTPDRDENGRFIRITGGPRDGQRVIPTDALGNRIRPSETDNYQFDVEIEVDGVKMWLPVLNFADRGDTEHRALAIPTRIPNDEREYSLVTTNGLTTLTIPNRDGSSSIVFTADESVGSETPMPIRHDLGLNLDSNGRPIH